MAQCKPRQHTSNNRKANLFSEGVYPVQDRAHQKSVKLAKPTQTGRGSVALTHAVNEHERASDAFMKQASRENFMWEREANKRVIKERQKLARKSD